MMSEGSSCWFCFRFSETLCGFQRNTKKLAPVSFHEKGFSWGKCERFCCVTPKNVTMWKTREISRGGNFQGGNFSSANVEEGRPLRNVGGRTIWSMLQQPKTDRHSSLPRVGKPACISPQVYERCGEIFKEEFSRTKSLEHRNLLSCRKSSTKDQWVRCRQFKEVKPTSYLDL